jgi:ADP-heptose:LPS heptosyltransferase
MRSKAFFINGGAGRVICSIPALEKYQEESGDKDFLIVCEGGTDFFKGHPTLYSRVYDHWHKNLFEDKLINMDLESPEPYRVWEYYNQKCNLTQAFDICINKKGIRELPRPNIKLSVDELLAGKNVVKEVKEKTSKDQVIVIQPFGRGVIVQDNMITDPSGRSFEPDNIINIIKQLQKKYAVIYMGDFGIDFAKHGCTSPVASPQNVSIRHWAGIIREADYFLGCDSVGQHIAYTLDKPATVIVGSTFKENISYPNNEKFDILDMGEDRRKYSPIRVTVDEVADRTNEGIMIMNDKIEEVIAQSVDNGIQHHVLGKKKK